MAGLCWMAVAFAFFLSAGSGLAAVNQDWLASTVEGIKDEYALGDTFSLAVNVPQNQDPDSLQQVFQDDPADTVTQTVSGGQVYRGTRMVAAAQSGALSRVLENIQPLVTSSQGNFLIIYSKESPCGPTCTKTNEADIPAGFNNVIQNWRGYAFVFTEVVNTSLISKLGLDNIFRCYKPGDDPFQCTSCSSGEGVTTSCVTNTGPANHEQDVDEEISTVPQDTFTGEEIAPGEGMGNEVATGMWEGMGGNEMDGRLSKCRGGGGLQQGCRNTGGGVAKKGRKQRGRRKGGRGGVAKKGRKQRGRRKGRKGGVAKKGRKERGRRKGGRGGVAKKGRKQRGRRKGGKGGVAKKGRKQRGRRKGGRGGVAKKGRKQKGRRKGRKGRKRKGKRRGKGIRLIGGGGKKRGRKWGWGK
ncbi:uncharacterized protein [Pempheris klunzingeri]|uniref:uncharacterized protein n=1 Tax=Pempheris klunzingeri TaxID=3127111 RepID=UPI00397F082E